MRFELTTTDLEGRGTTSCTTEMSKMIPNLPTFHWRRTLPRSDLAEQLARFHRNHRHISVN